MNPIVLAIAAGGILGIAIKGASKVLAPSKKTENVSKDKEDTDYEKVVFDRRKKRTTSDGSRSRRKHDSDSSKANRQSVKEDTKNDSQPENVS